MEIRLLPLRRVWFAFTIEVRIGHVEAGLRTFDKYSPYPEEMNRQMTDDLADLYFAPTGESKANLLKRNHPESSIVVTGNTAIDALKLTVQEKLSSRSTGSTWIQLKSHPLSPCMQKKKIKELP